MILLMKEVQFELFVTVSCHGDRLSKGSIFLGSDLIEVNFIDV